MRRFGVEGWSMLTLDGARCEQRDGVLAYHVRDCPEIRALVLNVPVTAGDLHLASAFDEALHPRAHKGETGGGRFIKKLLHELASGDKFEHPTLGTMERLPQGGAKRADGRLTVRSLVTGKRVHMNPTRAVDVAAPKAIRVKKASPGRKGPSALSKELKQQIGTPAEFDKRVKDIAGRGSMVTLLHGSRQERMRGKLEREAGGLRLTTATHVLETEHTRATGYAAGRFQTHEMGFPQDLEATAAKLRASKIIAGTHSKKGDPAYKSVRIRELGHAPENPTSQEAELIAKDRAGENAYLPWRMEHTRSTPVDAKDIAMLREDGGEPVYNPKSANRGMISDVSPFAKNVGMTSPSSRKAINATTRPPEGYFPGSENEEHILHAKPSRATGFRHYTSGSVFTGPEIARGPRREMEKLQREHAGSVIEPPKLHEVTFISPIDGSTVTRQLTPGEHEKFMRLVEKSPEAKVKDALPQLKGYSTEHAMENIRPMKLSSLEPGTEFFDRHASLAGVRGVEKKGGIEVHEKPAYGRGAIPTRIAQGDELVHVRAGKQTSLMPGRQVGHVHIAMGSGGFQRLVDRTGQEHATGLTQADATRRLREMNDAYDAEHGIGRMVRTATGSREVSREVVEPPLGGGGHHPTTGESVVVHMRGDHGAIPKQGVNEGYRDDAGAYRIRLQDGTGVLATPDRIQPLRAFAATGSPIAEAGRLRGIEHAVHSESQSEAEREARYLRSYERRFGSGGSAAIERSLSPTIRRIRQGR